MGKVWSVALCWTGGNRISQVLPRAHEGGIFSICVLKDGTMVSGGGKDRKLALWDREYCKQGDMEVSMSLGLQSKPLFNCWIHPI